MDTLQPVLLRGGLQALLNASNTGLEAAISHIALGGHNEGEGHSGYTPSAFDTALRRQRIVVPIADGNRVANSEVQIEALVDTGPEFWITEIGFIVDGSDDANGSYINGSGTMLAIWSEPANALAFKTNGNPLALAYNLAIESAPTNLINVNVTGPSIGLLLTENVAATAAGFMRTWRRMVQSDIEQFTPQIQTEWR